MPSASAFFPFDGESQAIGDLVAITKLIEHANKVTINDFATVKELLVKAQDERFDLDNDMAAWQARLGPACQEYAEARKQVLVGEGLVPPFAKSAVQAQGIVNNILSLGAQTTGCVNTCEYPGGIGAPGLSTCRPGKCSKVLKESLELEDVLSRKYWSDRDSAVLRICSRANDSSMFVHPPAGFGAADEEESAAEDQWTADEAKTLRAEAGLPPFALACLRPPPTAQPPRRAAPPPQQRRLLGGRRVGRRCGIRCLDPPRIALASCPCPRFWEAGADFL